MTRGEADAKYLDAGGVRTRYFDEGKGEPIVLLHGGIMGERNAAASAEDWELNFDAIARAHRAIAVDRLGQGRTDNPSRTADYTMSAVTAHLVEFLTALEQGPYHLVGHAEGGYSALRLAVYEPDLVASCTIVDSDTAAPGVGRSEYVLATNPHPRGSPEAVRFTHETRSADTAHISAAWLDRQMAFLAGEKHKQAIRKMGEEGLRASQFGPKLLAERLDLLDRLTLRPVQRPVLVYWGYNDPVAPIEMGLKLYDMTAKHQFRTQMHTVNKTGYFSFRERPDEFNRVVCEFVEGVSYGD
jgi:2-hydroxy-6-oxonona-2,4-dienedioate hydrolase